MPFDWREAQSPRRLRSMRESHFVAGRRLPTVDWMPPTDSPVIVDCLGLNFNSKSWALLDAYGYSLKSVPITCASPGRARPSFCRR